jgi:hypothetical protein
MTNLPSPWAPVSWGELLDKISILEIKQRRISDLTARANVTRELLALREAGAGVLRDRRIDPLRRALRSVNETLWDVEDAIRREEAQRRFGPEFIRLARSVYRQNDRRAELKRSINLALGSELIEEKSYHPADSPAEAPLPVIESVA